MENADIPAITKTNFSFFSFLGNLKANHVRIPPKIEKINAISAETKNKILTSNSRNTMKLEIITKNRINNIFTIKPSFDLFLFFILDIFFKNNAKRQ